MSSIILKEPANDKYLSDLEKLGIIVGALCHDVGHTGFTNTFEIESFSPRAILYNDISVTNNLLSR